MQYYEVALTQFRNLPHSVLTYSSNNLYDIGTLVKVPLRGKNNVGIVMKKVPKPKFTTKPIIGKITDYILPAESIKLAYWLSEYYQTSINAVLKMMVPRGVQVSRRKNNSNNRQELVARHNSDHELTNEQRKALTKIKKEKGTSLLYGVTGSGKTRLYIELASINLAAKRATVVLVPEISLTSQMVADFKNKFKEVFITHSTMTESERHKVWIEITKAKAPIVIGPRSALFVPVKALGLIIIDECHDSAYKQNTTPRFDTLKVARKLADFHDAKLVLGSATPSITDYFLASSKKRVVKLLQPITPRNTRRVSVIDMRKCSRDTIFSAEFLGQLSKSLSRNEQALVYHNRRGTAPTVLCNNCGWIAECPTCYVPMVLHHDQHTLRCHTCNTQNRLPTSCPECDNTDILFKGVGTKKIVSELGKLFPEALIARFDTDSTKSETVSSRYQDLYDGKIDIIVGTQMIAKGLDLPKLSFGGIVLADTGLSIPDYTTSERVFQLLHQVIGRVGRHTSSSYVGIQTIYPENPVIKLASKQDYESYYHWAIEQRKLGQYPPFSHLLLLTCAYASRKNAQQASAQALDEIGKLSITGLKVSGPSPSFYERRGNKYRWQLLVRSKSRSDLVKTARLFEQNPRWTVDLDPSSLL